MQKGLIAHNTENMMIQLRDDEINNSQHEQDLRIHQSCGKRIQQGGIFEPFSTQREVSPIGNVVEPDESVCNEAKEFEVIAVNSLT